MKIVARIVTLLLLFMSLIIFSACSRGSNNENTNSKNDEKGNDNEIILPGEVTDRVINSADDAILAIKDAKDELGLKSATDEISVSSVSIVDELAYYKLSQKYNGISVFGTEFVVVADKNGEVKSLVSNAVDIENVDTTPTLSYEVALASVAEYFDDFAIIPELSNDDLTIFADPDTGEASLAYATEAWVSGQYYYVVIDAKGGEVLQSFCSRYTSDVKAPTVEEMLRDRVDVLYADGCELQKLVFKLDGEYYYFDEDKPYSYLYDVDGNKRYLLKLNKEKGQYDVCDLSGKPSDIVFGNQKIIDILYTLKSTGKNKVACNMESDMLVSEPEGVKNSERASLLTEKLAISHAFFGEVLGRKGYDGKDGNIIAVVDEKKIGQMAYSAPWNDKTIISVEKGVNIETDLIGHEYMHSVERSISGMFYQGESGAIMEGYSDIFGELIEDFEIDGALDGDCDWKNGSNRNMKNPKKQPQKYLGKYWASTINLGEDNDYGGVHHNSTVISHAAYLMTLSSTGGDALSQEELAKLWYNTLFALPKNCSFETLCKNMLTVASDLGYSSDKIKCIESAFDIVGIRKKDTGFEAKYTGGLEFESKDDGSCKIIGIGECTDANLAIPVFNSDGLAVSEIADHAFDGCDFLKSVVIPTSIKKIGVSAFRDCESLETVIIEDDGVAEIGPWAFAGCSRLDYLLLGNSLEIIKNNSFDGCTYLSEVQIPDSVTVIEDEAFIYCESLMKIVFGKDSSLELISDRAFYECVSLASVTIPDRTESIGTSAFRGCITLEKVTLGRGLKSIGAWCFAECCALRTVEKGRSIETILNNAFSDCSSLLEMHFSDSVRVIGDEAFMRCSSLKEISFDRSSCLEEIGDHAFDGCSVLCEAVLPDSLKKIGASAFMDCKGLELVVFGIGLESINGWAFSECDAIADVCYRGSEEMWNKINIGDNNRSITDCSIYYNFTSFEALNYICITRLPLLSSDRYTGNEGDSKMYILGGSEYRNGGKGIDGGIYRNGLEMWVARWNFSPEISWVENTYSLGGGFSRFVGKIGLIDSYNTDNFNTTFYVYGDGILLHSVAVTAENCNDSFSVDVSGISELKLLVRDNEAVAGGTSFALYDAFLKK